MRSDGPTVPHLGRQESDMAPYHGPFGETPIWPPKGERDFRALGPDRLPTRSVPAMVFGVSLGANVVLFLGLLSVILLSHAGVFAPGGSNGLPPGAVLNSATATASATAGQISGWLAVTPSRVQLGCERGQRTQLVVVANSGPQKVHWQAVIVGSGSADHVGVAITPRQGDLDAGAHASVQLQNTTHAADAPGGSGQHGIISFTPTSVAAGSPPRVSYTTLGCP
jgi:hypothetical protein